MAISFEEAKEILLSSLKPKEEIEKVELQDSLNRVLAKDIYANRDLPPFNNSAMDGYALKFKDINYPLKIKATVLAGFNQNPILEDKEAYKIMTGAKVPNDADTVVQKEFCKESEGVVEVEKSVKVGNAIRIKGEEVKKGALILEKGEILTYPKIALLASQGVIELDVFKRIKIAVVSTGSELKEPWEEASDDEIYNINSLNILMALKSYGFNVKYVRRVDDNLESLTLLFKELSSFDVIITTGGISVGSADFTKEALLNNGFKEFFHGVRVKPGHPFMAGSLRDSLVVALPGNPLAAILNFLLVALLAIYKIQGADSFRFKECRVKMGSDLKLKAGRTNLVLGEIIDGKFYPYRGNRYGSGMVTPLTKSGAIAIFNEDIGFLSEGVEIDVVLL